LEGTVPKRNHKKEKRNAPASASPLDIPAAKGRSSATNGAKDTATGERAKAGLLERRDTHVWAPLVWRSTPIFSKRKCIAKKQ